jgi:hypothetical protein
MLYVFIVWCAMFLFQHYVMMQAIICFTVMQSCITNVFIWAKLLPDSIKKTPWPESASELYRLSDCRLSAKLVQSFADRGCHVVRVTDPYGSNLGFLDRSRCFFFQVAPQLSWGWVDPIPDPLLLRKPGSTRNWTQTSGSVARYSDHQTTEEVSITQFYYYFMAVHPDHFIPEIDLCITY